MGNPGNGLQLVRNVEPPPALCSMIADSKGPSNEEKGSFLSFSFRDVLPEAHSVCLLAARSGLPSVPTNLGLCLACSLCWQVEGSVMHFQCFLCQPCLTCCLWQELIRKRSKALQRRRPLSPPATPPAAPIPRQMKPLMPGRAADCGRQRHSIAH